MRKIRLVKTNQSPTGLAAVLEAGGTWGQVSLHFLSVFLIIWVSEQYWFIIPVTLLASLLALSSNPIQSNHLRCFLLLLLQIVAQSFLSDCTEVNHESRMCKYIRGSTYKITASHIFPSVQRSTRFTLCTAGPTSHQSTSIQLSSWPVQKCWGKKDSRSYLDICHHCQIESRSGEVTTL